MIKVNILIPRIANKICKLPLNKQIHVVYTDGSCRNHMSKNAVAGYGIYWGDGHKDNISAPVSGLPTNNRAEYEAVAVAIEQAKVRGYKRIKIYTDSLLLVNSVKKWLPKWKENNWKRANGKKIKNKDLLERIEKNLSKVDVLFEHVSGHSGIIGNEMAHKLAEEGAKLYNNDKNKD